MTPSSKIPTETGRASQHRSPVSLPPSERIRISDQPPPSGNVPPWVKERLAKVRHRATPFTSTPYSIGKSYGSSDGTTNQ